MTRLWCTKYVLLTACRPQMIISAAAWMIGKEGAYATKINTTQSVPNWRQSVGLFCRILVEALMQGLGAGCMPRRYKIYKVKLKLAGTPDYPNQSATVGMGKCTI